MNRLHFAQMRSIETAASRKRKRAFRMLPEFAVVILRWFHAWTFIAAFSVIGTNRAFARTEDSRLRELIEAHSATMGLIHRFDIEVTIWDKALIGPYSKEPAQKTGTWRWSGDGNVERIRNRDFKLDTQHPGPQGENFLDVFDGGTNRMLLRNWNPEKPPSITPFKQAGVKGVVGPRSNVMPGLLADLSVFLLMRYRNVRDETDPRQILSDLASSSPNVTVLPSEPDIDHGLIRIRVVRPGKVTEAQASDYFDFYLDPAAGLMVRKLVEYYPSSEWYGESGKVERLLVRWVREVKKFKDVGSGAFFPIETELNIYRSGRDEPTAVVRAVANRVVVNEPLPSDALDFKFPENLLVQYPVKDGKIPVKLWGANNQPKKDISNKEDLLALANLEDSSKTKGRSELNSIIVFGLNIAVIVVIGIVLLLRYRKLHAH